MIRMNRIELTQALFGALALAASCAAHARPMVVDPRDDVTFNALASRAGRDRRRVDRCASNGCQFTRRRLSNISPNRTALKGHRLTDDRRTVITAAFLSFDAAKVKRKEAEVGSARRCRQRGLGMPAWKRGIY